MFCWGFCSYEVIIKIFLLFTILDNMGFNNSVIY